MLKTILFSTIFAVSALANAQYGSDPAYVPNMDNPAMDNSIQEAIVNSQSVQNALGAKVETITYKSGLLKTRVYASAQGCTVRVKLTNNLDVWTATAAANSLVCK